MKQDISFVLNGTSEIAESMLFLPLNLLDLAVLAVRLKARHEPEILVSLVIGAGAFLLIATHGPALAAFYPFAWISGLLRRIWDRLTSRDTKEARRRASNSLYTVACSVRDRTRGENINERDSEISRR